MALAFTPVDNFPSMHCRLRPPILIAGILALVAGANLHADPVAEMASFSVFKTVNLEKLASGTVMSVRGVPMSGARDLALESCYVVRKPLQKTADFQRLWNAARHSELKVYLHADFPLPPNAAQFQQVGNAPANASVKALMAVTEKLPASSAELQLSNADAKAFKPGSGFAAYWSNLLFHRAETYVSGGFAALPPYETKGEAVRNGDEIARLLKEAGKVRTQFSTLLDGTPLLGGKAAFPASFYWEMFDVEGLAAFNLGVLYGRSTPGGYQSVDAQYYASGGYYTFLTFCQMWPVTIGSQECTLVWRGDLISSPGLASLHGVERMGSSTAMMRETQRNIKCLLDDASKSP